jgi:hypothetical protein
VKVKWRGWFSNYLRNEQVECVVRAAVESKLRSFTLESEHGSLLLDKDLHLIVGKVLCVGVVEQEGLRNIDRFYRVKVLVVTCNGQKEKQLPSRVNSPQSMW